VCVCVCVCVCVYIFWQGNNETSSKPNYSFRLLITWWQIL